MNWILFGCEEEKLHKCSTNALPTQSWVMNLIWFRCDEEKLHKCSSNAHHHNHKWWIEYYFLPTEFIKKMMILAFMSWDIIIDLMQILLTTIIINDKLNIIWVWEGRTAQMLYICSTNTIKKMNWILFGCEKEKLHKCSTNALPSQS